MLGVIRLLHRNVCVLVPAATYGLVTSWCCSVTCVLPASAVLAVENRVGQLVPVRLGRRAPGQLDEAGGDQRGHDVAGGGGGGPRRTGHASGAWRYMVSSVRSQ